MNQVLFVIELVAAAWYLAFVLTKMGGPFQLFDKAREWQGGRWHGRTGGWYINYPEKTLMHDGLMDCIICLMPYISFGLLLLHHFHLDLLFLPFSMAGLALWAHSSFGWLGRS